MSIDALRDGQLTAKRNDIASILRSRSKALRSINKITAAVTRNVGLGEIRLDLDASPSEEAFLDANDLANGRYFDHSILKYPIVPQDAAATSIHVPKLDSTSPQPTDQVSSVSIAAGADGVASEAAVIDLPADMAAAAVQQALDDFRPTVLPRDVPSSLSAPARDSPGAVPSRIADPQPEEQAQLNAHTEEMLDLKGPQKPAKTVHLPPQKEQEERLREVDHDLKEARRKSDSEPEKTSRLAPSVLQTELASSPSSTVGAWSATTPMPAQGSPDTSPDSENLQVDIPPPRDLRPTQEESHAKEEHDRLLEAQKEIARQGALGDVATATPDDQLRLEEEQATKARKAEESNERGAGPEPNARADVEPTEAEEVMEGAQKDHSLETAQQPKPAAEAPKDTPHGNMPPPLSRKSTVEEDNSMREHTNAEEYGDNIVVTPRQPLPKPASVRRQQSQSTCDTPTSAGPEGRTTRISSGAMRQKSVSEIIGETPKPPASMIRTARVSSPEAMSPTAMRRASDHPAYDLSSEYVQTPARTAQERPPLPPTPSRNTSVLPLSGDYAALKGAAQDPSKDYLEPLFRIQAYDATEQHPGKPLTGLLRSASKTISTSDHFATIHERQDFRILRRIYHLQNANKWSLRQMEKSKEPEQPKCHLDHMMAEMKWMRKDFKEERKLKKAQCREMALMCAEFVALRDASPGDEKALQMGGALRRQAAGQSAEIEHPTGHAPELQTVVSAVPHEDVPPDLLPSAQDDSAPEDDAAPRTPKDDAPLQMDTWPPELEDALSALDNAGKLEKAVSQLPVYGNPFEEALPGASTKPSRRTMPTVSKFCDGKILAKFTGPSRKRSRYDYEEDADVFGVESDHKRLRHEQDIPPEQEDIALFHPENKHIRDRLHANNAFRPPSEFPMPTTQFYEFRRHSEWIWDDDQKLRKLAKDYSFNWSLIAEEMALPSRLKSATERRTPWECFERWVELETLPAEMRKTLYFKTWGQRLDLAAQGVERRYQSALAATQQNGNQSHMPMRRRTIPLRVDKRKNSRYLHLVDAMRKQARKREQQQYKLSEAQKSAAQRKQHQDSTQPRTQMLTPQEFSKKRYERDCQIAEAQRQHRQRVAEAQRQQMQLRAGALGQQQGLPNGTAAQQRPGSSAMSGAGQVQPNGLPQQGGNGQVPPQSRQSLPIATTRNGHLAVPQMHAQGIPQAQMQANMRANGMSQSHHPTPQDMQRIAQANAQARGQQYSNQQFSMPNASVLSPGGLTNSQQLAQNQAMLAAMQNATSNVGNGLSMTQSSNGQGMQNNGQMSASPHMPPPPTPGGSQHAPQSLSSGHVPVVLQIKSQLRAKYPHLSDAQIQTMTNDQLKQQNATNHEARQSAMNAAAGINGASPMPSTNTLNAYNQNQTAFQGNATLTNGNSPYGNSDGTPSQAGVTSANTSPQANYAQMMRSRQMQQMRHAQSPNATHASLHGSPGMAAASPNMTPVSPNMQYSNMNMAGMTGMGVNGGQRPPSRGNTPQMQRLGSSGSIAGVNGGGMQSPGAMQGSPRNMQAGLAR